MNSFAFTCGDTNGLGPEIVIKTLNKITRRKSNNIYYFICPLNIFEATAKQITPEFSYEVINKLNNITSSNVIILDSGYARQRLGKSTVTSGKSSFNALQKSFSMLRSNLVNAVITAPISKTAMNRAGIHFTGHTEMLAKWSNTEDYVMTFLSKQICTALVTIHNPLRNVSKLLNKNRLETVVNVLDRTLRFDLKITDPKIAVLGLNPHAGESGLLGREEIEVIVPVIKRCSRKIKVEGPFPADAFFARKLYKNYNIVLCMYHDQALIPFKLLNPCGGVNYTAGLPIIRTSPDHGVAYDIAGDYVADESSMIQAFFYAEKIVNNRKKHIGN